MTNDDRPSSAAARKAGRPTPEAAREISSRITAAAEDLFVELGFERTTMDEVAHRAHVSKRTLYSRFPGKEELFLAAAERIGERKTSELEAVQVPMRELPAALEAFARKLVSVMTEPRLIAFERIMAAEASRFPALAAARSRAGLDHLAECVGRMLRDEHPFSAMDEAELELRSRLFLALTVLPSLRRAMYGEDATDETDGDFIARAVEMFLAGSDEGRKTPGRSARYGAGEGPAVTPPREAEPHAGSEATEATPRRRRRRSAGLSTKDRILKAAIQRFGAASYDDTGLRDIASDVGVDVAYVHRSFGSKEALFVKALETVAGENETWFKKGIPKEELPRRLAELLAQSDDFHYEEVRSLDIVIRSLGSPAAKLILNRRLQEGLIGPVSQELAAPREARATMIAAVLLGVGIVRNVLQLPGLAVETHHAASLLTGIVAGIIEADLPAGER